MIKTTAFKSLSALICLLAAVSATAQSPLANDPMANNAAGLAPAGDTASQIAFAYADRDEDLVISWEEYRNRAMRLFGHVDANNDGILQVAELQALAGPSAPKPAADISAATFNAAMRKLFDSGDANKDGALTPAEWHDTIRPSRAF
ncbi:EF-hand domain-containing protein [Sandaracinobacteroides hominis]|uniref:hypothetical protein n=1 Tax=Sandaracinobacteroides hominis TaxID=2780086 RepID=UPI0018F2F8ED|nr:hypothetical protein [Sandaracinobacteroides hominis]